MLNSDFQTKAEDVSMLWEFPWVHRILRIYNWFWLVGVCLNMGYIAPIYGEFNGEHGDKQWTFGVPYFQAAPSWSSGSADDK